jgi:hypothetical protein
MKLKGMEPTSGLVAGGTRPNSAQDSQPKPESVKYGFKERIKMSSATMKCLTSCLFILAFLALAASRAAAVNPGQGFLCSELDTSTNNTVEVYYRGYDSNLYEIDEDTNKWFQVTGGAGQGSSPARNTGVVACYVNTIYNGNEVIYLTADSQGNLDVEELYGSGFYPTDLTVKTNAQHAAPGSSLVGYIDPIAGTNNVFYLGTDQQVHLLLWSPVGGWSTSTVYTGAPLAAVGSALSGHMTSNSEEIFYLGSGGQIYELWRWSQNFDGWNLARANPYPETLAEPGSPLACFYDTVAGVDEMFYLGTNQHVDALIFSVNQWIGLDLSALTGVPAAWYSRLAAHLNTNTGGSDEVYFQDTSNTRKGLMEFWAWSASWTTWNAKGDPYPSGIPHLATDFDNHDVDEVFYTNGNGDIYEVFSGRDITARSHAPAAVQ